MTLLATLQYLALYIITVESGQDPGHTRRDQIRPDLKRITAGRLYRTSDLNETTRAGQTVEYRCPAATEHLSSQGQAKFSGNRRQAATTSVPNFCAALVIHNASHEYKHPANKSTIIAANFTNRYIPVPIIPISLRNSNLHPKEIAGYIYTGENAVVLLIGLLNNLL